MSKWEHRDVKKLVLGHTAGEGVEPALSNWFQILTKAKRGSTEAFN